LSAKWTKYDVSHLRRLDVDASDRGGGGSGLAAVIAGVVVGGGADCVGRWLRSVLCLRRWLHLNELRC
jgi:hypothetical protein